MAAIPIAMPRIVSGQLSGNSPIMQKPSVLEALSQSWLKSSLVYVTGTGADVRLSVCPAAATLIYGLAPQAATTQGNTTGPVTQGPLVQPPQSLFGAMHYPQDLRGVLLEISVTGGSLSGADIGAGGITWTTGALAPGLQCGLATLTSGTYNKYQVLDYDNVTQKLFEIVQLAPSFGGIKQTVTDNNPRVWVKLIDSVLQG